MNIILAVNKAGIIGHLIGCGRILILYVNGKDGRRGSLQIAGQLVGFGQRIGIERKIPEADITATAGYYRIIAAGIKRVIIAVLCICHQRDFNRRTVARQSKLSAGQHTVRIGTAGMVAVGIIVCLVNLERLCIA